MAEEEQKTIELGEQVTVGDFARMLGEPIGVVMSSLIKNGVMATVNESIDRDTAEIIASEFDVEVVAEKTQKEKRAERSEVDTAGTRPPVVAVMGHVDHGKTSLLDAIREADTAQGEAGGITQHISAYQVTHNKRLITFLDTPGHEAFAALRQHGAQLTDVAVVVIAADDGIKPQTKEAINFAQRAGVKMVVAVNKIDKPGADPVRVRTELADMGLNPEEWGGDTVVVDVSAKQKKGLTELLDIVLLVTDIEELKGDVSGEAEGIVIESYMEPGRGPLVRILVEHGMLKKGDIVIAGSSFGKVRTLEDFQGNEIETAGPSTPATVTGFKDLPAFGDVFMVAPTEKEARKLASVSRQQQANRQSDSVKSITDGAGIESLLAAQDTSTLPIIIKADVQGSLESVIQSLESIDSDEVSVDIVSSGVGPVNETDVTRAQTSNAIILGFNVPIPVTIKRLALREQVSIKPYTVIYELIDEVKALLSKLLPAEVVETDIGRLKVKGVFRTTRNEIICGGLVSKGKVQANALVRITRDKEAIGEAVVTSVKREDAEAKEVFEGEMCGLQLKTTKKIQLKEGDNLDLFTREEIERTL
jgi:translation initiation factor IF-2